MQDGSVEAHTFKSLMATPKFAFTGMKPFWVGMATVGDEFSSRSPFFWSSSVIPIPKPHPPRIKYKIPLEMLSCEQEL